LKTADPLPSRHYGKQFFLRAAGSSLASQPSGLDPGGPPPSTGHLGITHGRARRVAKAVIAVAAQRGPDAIPLLPAKVEGSVYLPLPSRVRALCACVLRR
jgi:hypothetical protein